MEAWIRGLLGAFEALYLWTVALGTALLDKEIVVGLGGMTGECHRHAQKQCIVRDITMNLGQSDHSTSDARNNALPPKPVRRRTARAWPLIHTRLPYDTDS